MIKNPFIYSKPSVHPLQAGNVLVSVPLSGGFYFDRTVILLVNHNEKGSFGIVLNRSLPITLRDIFSDAEKTHDGIPIFNGGPVEMDNLFALHTYGDLIKGSLPVTDGLYFGGFSLELFESLQDDLLDENLIRFYLGYAGWSAGQLESELNKNMWIIGKFQEKLLFHNDNEKCWKMAVTALGDPYISWFNIARSPFLN